MENTLNKIETNDLFKGAYLLSQSFRLKETLFIDNHQVRFVIEGDNIKAEDLRYHTGQALVDPLRLKECVRVLREILTQTLKTHQPQNRYAKNSGRNLKKG